MTPAEQVAALQAEIARLDPAAQAMAQSFAQFLRRDRERMAAVVLASALVSAENAAATEQNA